LEKVLNKRQDVRSWMKLNYCLLDTVTARERERERSRVRKGFFEKAVMGSNRRKESW